MPIFGLLLLYHTSLRESTGNFSTFCLVYAGPVFCLACVCFNPENSVWARYLGTETMSLTSLTFGWVCLYVSTTRFTSSSLSARQVRLLKMASWETVACSGWARSIHWRVWLVLEVMVVSTAVCLPCVGFGCHFPFPPLRWDLGLCSYLPSYVLRDA